MTSHVCILWLENYTSVLGWFVRKWINTKLNEGSGSRVKLFFILYVFLKAPFPLKGKGQDDDNVLLSLRLVDVKTGGQKIAVYSRTSIKRPPI